MEYPKFKVAVSCMTYNQSKYITDTMNGFTMQQTDFPFVCTIVDDASTDGEQEVISKYLEENFDFSDDSVAYHKETDYAHITYAQHKTNKYCFFAVLYLKENHYSQKKDKSPYLKEWRDGVEYMALCEGDDYWIVPNKLKMQIDFFENNPNYTLCFTNAIVHHQDGNRKDKKFVRENADSRDYDGCELYRKWLVPTASIMYRLIINKTDLYKKAIADKRFIYGDNRLIVICASLGKVRFCNIASCVYRRNEGGVTYRNSCSQKISLIEQQSAYPELFGEKYKKISVNKIVDISVSGIYRSIYEKKFQITGFFFMKAIETSLFKTILYIVAYPIKHLIKILKNDF